MKLQNPKSQILLSVFVSSTGIECEERDNVLLVLEGYKSRNVDFIDAYLAQHALSSDAEKVISFDKKNFVRLGEKIIEPDVVLSGIGSDSQKAHRRRLILLWFLIAEGQSFLVCFYWLCWLIELIPNSNSLSGILLYNIKNKERYTQTLDFVLSPGKREKSDVLMMKNLRSISEKQVMCNGNESNNYVKI